MAKQQSGGSGLMSSAGLMRYYDADKKAIHVQPKGVVAFGVVVGVVVLALNAAYGLWP